VGARAVRRLRLEAEIGRLFRLHAGTYGSPRITADLRDGGWKVSQNTVAAVMRELGLAARPKSRRKVTTRPGRGRWRAPDLVRRDFGARHINQKWYGDGTEIRTDEGKLHLASVLDVASRRVVGFALSEHHDAALAYGALAMAVAVRGGSVPGVILHTDSEYGRAGGPGLPDPHADGRARIAGARLLPGFLTLTPIDGLLSFLGFVGCPGAPGEAPGLADGVT
jgi:putative transposase